MSDAGQGQVSGSDGGVSGGGGAPSDTGGGGSSGSAGQAPSTPSSYSPSRDLGISGAPESVPAAGGLRDEDGPEEVDFLSGFETGPAEEVDPTSPPAPSGPDSAPPIAASPPLQEAPAQAPPQGQAPQAAPEGQAPAQAAEAPLESPESLEDFMTLAVQNPQWVLEKLAQDSDFIPSDQDMETLMSGDTPAVKQTFANFGAKMHYRAVMTTMNLIQNWVPKLIAQGVQAQQKESEIRSQFQSKFPQLDLGNKQVMELVAEAASRVKAIPGLTPEQRLMRVGNTVATLLGLPSVVGGGQAPPTRQAGFVPANGGNAMPPPKTTEPDMWGGLARDYDG